MRIRRLIPLALLVVLGPPGASPAAAIDPVNGQWSSLPITAATPPARSGHAAALRTSQLDPTVLDLLVTGGATSAPSTVWALSLGDAPAWTAWVPTGGAVDTASGVTFVDQYPSGQFIRFGGAPFSPRVDFFTALFGPSEPPSTAWFSGTPFPQGLGRARHAAAAPPNLFAMYVYGGHGPLAGQPADSAFFLDDLWMMDGLGWHLIAPKGAHPSPREGHTMVYDGAYNRLLVFGGDTLAAGTPVALNDTWAFNLADSTWSRLDFNGPPRTGHVAFYDPVRARMVVIGGRDGTGAATADVWALSLAGSTAWSQLAPDSLPPAPRYAAAGAYDPLRDRFALFGGIAALDTASAETWLLSFGRTAAPRLACSGSVSALPGEHVTFTGVVTSQLGAPQIHQIAFGSAGGSAWFKAAASQSIAIRQSLLLPGASDTLRYTIAIPDTAGASTSLYAFTAAATQVPAASAPCPCRLTVTPLDAVPSFEVTRGIVTLTWEVSGPGAPLPAVQRRLVGAASWDSLGVATLRGGLAEFVDSTLAAGAAADYRLSFLIEGTPVVRGQVRVQAPGPPPPATLELAGAWPNPSAGPLRVSFGLPDASPATLDVIDVTGRLVASRAVSGLGAGAHVLTLAEVGRPGLYFVRLRQGASEKIARVCVIP